MAKVRPFKGFRPSPELAPVVSSRPYDVLSSQEAYDECKGNEKSLYHIIKPEINFDPIADEHDPKVYDVAVEHSRSSSRMVGSSRTLLLIIIFIARPWMVAPNMAS